MAHAPLAIVARNALRAAPSGRNRLRVRIGVVREESARATKRAARSSLTAIAQRKGVGAALVREGARRLRQRGCPFAVVLGHPTYYPRFGFVPARRHDLRCQWDVPEEAFMVLLLEASAAARVAGVAHYREEFSATLTAATGSE